VDCIESTADAGTCTTCAQELYTLTTAAANGGQACVGSSTLCTHGQGSASCPDPVDCVESTDDARFCTACGQELYTLTKAAANGGAACVGSSALCTHGQGSASCPDPAEEPPVTGNVQCAGMPAGDYCDCGGDCGGSFCECAEALACCAGGDAEEVEIPSGCCESFGFGSEMKRCCWSYKDDVAASDCDGSGMMGGGRVHNPGRKCADVPKASGAVARLVSASAPLWAVILVSLSQLRILMV
jgi:hypothetical protein